MLCSLRDPNGLGELVQGLLARHCERTGDYGDPSDLDQVGDILVRGLCVRGQEEDMKVQSPFSAPFGHGFHSKMSRFAVVVQSGWMSFRMDHCLPMEFKQHYSVHVCSSSFQPHYQRICLPEAGVTPMFVPRGPDPSELKVWLPMLIFPCLLLAFDLRIVEML